MPRRAHFRGWFVGAVLCASLNAAPPPAFLQGSLQIDSAPSLSWSVQLAHPAETETTTATPAVQLLASAKAEGLDLRVIANPLPDGNGFSWQIDSGIIDPATWWPAARSRAGLDKTLAGWGVGGQITVTGQGTWIDGQPSGWIELAWDNGSIFNDDTGVDMGNISARIHTEDLTTFALPAGQRIQIGQATSGGITARNIEVEFSRTADGIINLTNATANIFGGSVTVEPLKINPDAPRLTAAIRFTGLSLFELVTFVPAAIASADGKLTGRGTVDWDLNAKLPEDIHLRIEKSDNAHLTLAAKPGFLTSGIPTRIALVPSNWGLLARLFSPENPTYEPLVDIEMGRTPLTVETMDLSINPNNTNGTRSARLSLTTRPIKPGVIKSLSLDININGSLSQVIALGLDERIHAATP